MRPFRVGIFERETSATEGGADTLRRMLRAGAHWPGDARRLELLRVPWADWDYRRRPVRRLASRVARAAGVHLPYVDLRGDCRRLRLDAAYFPAPVFAAIDVPYVFTLWDLGHRTVPQFPEMTQGPDTGAQREALCRRMLGGAAFVVTANEAGADEIRRFYAVPAARIAVVPFPNPDLGGVVAVRPPWLSAAPYFFYPAQFWAHKNHAVLLRALAALAQERGMRPHLVLAGADKGCQARIQALARELGLSAQVHFPGFVSTEELKGLYEGAVALVFPSMLGPNNLPPQEAAVLGCPVILSDLAGHRQQLGDGARYCAPEDPGAWARAMEELLQGPDARAELARKARVAVAGYTTAAYAEAIVALCTRLAGEHAR